MNVKSQKEIQAMREGGMILSRIMEEIGENIIPGKNTYELDKLAEELVFVNGGTPVFKGYPSGSGSPFPGTICASINDEIVHGIPREDRVIRKGDIVKIDIGMKYQGLITDMARTFPAGKISSQASKLVEATRRSLDLGISQLREGARLSDYSRAVQEYVEKEGFSVVRDLVGHGVGRKLHEDPMIPNYLAEGKEIILKAGMTLALEPMINQGNYNIRIANDGWTYLTTDGKLSAHFEDTVVITNDGPEILTR